MDDKCSMNPERECLGLMKAKEVAGDLKALDRKVTEFQQSVADTNNRFGARIGKLEAGEEVQKEQYKHIREKIETLTKEVTEFQREQKDSIGELRREHKESMNELKRSNKEILDIVSPLKHKVEEIDELAEDVETLKSKPGQTWEEIKKQGIGWILGIILAIVAVALGLEKFL